MAITTGSIVGISLQGVLVVLALTLVGKDLYERFSDDNTSIKRPPSNYSSNRRSYKQRNSSTNKSPNKSSNNNFRLVRSQSRSNKYRSTNSGKPFSYIIRSNTPSSGGSNVTTRRRGR